MGNTPDISTALSQILQQSGGALSSPFQPTPKTAGGGIDPSAHPVLAKVIQGLSNAAGAYGWTAMSPQEREQRTQMEQQKAETMARLGQTGVYQQGELEYRKSLADVAARNAATREGELGRKVSFDEFRQGMMKQQEEDKVNHNKAIEALQQGRIDEASRRNDAYLESVKNRYQVAEQNVGLGYGKLAVQEDLANILRYRSQLEAISTQQRGTDMGIKATQELAKMESDHWIQNLLGMGGVPTSQGAVQQAVPLPGAIAPTAGAPASQPTAPLPPPAPNKAEAKRRQKTPKVGGVTHVFIPGKGIQPVGGQPQ